MTVVNATELLPNGRTPIKGGKVKIAIAASPPATNTLDQSVVGVVKKTSDASGHWSANLVANSQISPAGTWYVVRRTYPASAGGDRIEEYITVPSSGGPYNFEALKESEPAAPPLTESEL